MKTVVFKTMALNYNYQQPREEKNSKSLYLSIKKQIMWDLEQGLRHRGCKKKTKKLRDARRAVSPTKQRGDKNTDHL